jgi:hypothetical protein
MSEPKRPYVACVRPVSDAQASTSGQSHAGLPPTVQRGSGSTPRKRHTSTVSRFTPSRDAISGMPTGSQSFTKETVANLLTVDQGCSDSCYMTQTRKSAAALVSGDVIAVEPSPLRFSGEALTVTQPSRVRKRSQAWSTVLGTRRTSARGYGGKPYTVIAVNTAEGPITLLPQTMCATHE